MEREKNKGQKEKRKKDEKGRSTRTFVESPDPAASDDEIYTAIVT